MPNLEDDGGLLLDTVLDALYFYISQMIDWLQGFVATLLDSLGTIIFQFVDALYEGLSNVFTYLTQVLEGIFSNLEGLVTAVVDTLSQALDGIWQKVIDASFAVIDEIHQFVSDAWAKLTSFAETLLNNVANLTDTVIGFLQGLATSAMNAVGSVADAITTGIGDLVDAALQFVKDTIDKLSNLINDAWDQLVTGAESILDAVGEKLGDLGKAFADAASDLVEEIGKLGEDAIGPIRDAVKDFVEAYMPTTDPATMQRGIAALEGIHTDPASMAVFRAWWEAEWRDLAQAGGIRQAVFFFVFTLASLLPTISGISQVLSQQSLQEYAFQYPYQILSPVDATNAWRRGLIAEGEAIGQIRRGGYSERQASMILKLTSVVPAAQDMVQMRWRGIINDDQLDEGLKHQGIDEPWRGRIRAAAVVIPPVNDLIHMAVRDIWNPQAVELGKLYEAYPDELGEWGEKQGLTDEWARNYWAAHWALPSPLQGFEMLHRKVINEAQLDTLLQALDVAPGWRDPVKEIAYHPFTRVDVRRMHALGILSESEVTVAYEDLGYDHDKAAALTEFTVRLNEPKGAEDEEELGRLNRTSIINFYTDGILDRDRALKLLVDLGNSPEAASLYLESADLDEQRTERKSEADLIIEQAEAGAITFDEAADKLRGLGLETREVEKALTRLLRAQQSRTKIPSRADADGFYKLGLIQDGDYLDIVSRNGYAKRWADLYLRQARVKRQKG